MLDVELIPSVVSVSAPPPQGRVPDPGWRPQSHSRADPGLLPVLSGVGRPRFTPAHATWLNQAELLNHAFSYHYLRRGSWTSREEFIAHIAISWPEYNARYAHPFEWTWTNRKMRKWFAEHAR